MSGGYVPKTIKVAQARDLVRELLGDAAAERFETEVLRKKASVFITVSDEDLHLVATYFTTGEMPEERRRKLPMALFRVAHKVLRENKLVRGRFLAAIDSLQKNVTEAIREEGEKQNVEDESSPVDPRQHSGPREYDPVAGTTGDRWICPFDPNHKVKNNLHNVRVHLIQQHDHARIDSATGEVLPPKKKGNK